MRTNAYIAILLALAITSCKSGMTKDPFPESDSVPPDLEITLSRTQCYGTCPAYRLTVTADGLLKFEGEKHTAETQGSSKLTDEKLKRLVGEFRSARYFEFDDEYSFKNCPSAATDMATVTTSIRINGTYKKVSHYLGCGSPDKPYPPGLTDLEKAIDSITDSRRWIEKRETK